MEHLPGDPTQALLPSGLLLKGSDLSPLCSVLGSQHGREHDPGVTVCVTARNYSSLPRTKGIYLSHGGRAI